MSTPSSGMGSGHGQGKWFACIRKHAPAGWYAYLVKTNPFPLAPEDRLMLMEAVAELVNLVRRAEGWNRSVWLLLDELHQENAVVEISRNAAIWQPEMGMGMRPEGPSPRYWSGSDLLDREYSEKMPVLKHTVVGLETDDAGADLACGLMSGRGALLQVLYAGQRQMLLDSWYEQLQPTIEESGLAAYPVYVPLLSAASVQRGNSEMLDAWMGEAMVYLRESVEDEGVLVVSRVALDDLVTQTARLRLEQSVPPDASPQHSGD